MVDMDRFNIINHSYDTFVGDDVIKAMAHNIQEHLQVGDVLVRNSSDTFCVVLYDYEDDYVAEVAEAIRLSFKKKIRVTTYAILKNVSIGVALFPTQTPDILEAIEWAKRALIEAKHQGGDTVVVFGPKSMPI